MTLLIDRPALVTHDPEAIGPEMELCDVCPQPDEPNIPQFILGRTTWLDAVPDEWDPAWGSAPLVEVTELSCGHTLSVAVS